MSLMRAMGIAAAGLTAQRVRMEVIASNLANVSTTRTAAGGPYQRQQPVFTAQPVAGPFSDVLGESLRTVKVESIVLDPSPPVKRFEPGHPDADPAGFVSYPNVDPTVEMVDMLSASRSYSANVTLIRAVRAMTRAIIQIIV